MQVLLQKFKMLTVHDTECCVNSLEKTRIICHIFSIGSLTSKHGKSFCQKTFDQSYFQNLRKKSEFFSTPGSSSDSNCRSRLAPTCFGNAPRRHGHSGWPAGWFRRVVWPAIPYLRTWLPARLCRDDGQPICRLRCVRFNGVHIRSGHLQFTASHASLHDRIQRSEL